MAYIRRRPQPGGDCGASDADISFGNDESVFTPAPRKIQAIPECEAEAFAWGYGIPPADHLTECRAMWLRLRIRGVPLPAELRIILIAGGGHRSRLVRRARHLRGARRDSAHMSGSRVLQADADCELAVSDSNGTRTVTHMKMRDGGLTEPFNFELVKIELGTDEDGDAINSCAVGAVTAAPRREAGPHLTKNQQTMLTILQDAGPNGLTQEEWNDQAREGGLGVKRRSDLLDHRSALKRKKLVHSYADRWHVTAR